MQLNNYASVEPEQTSLRTLSENELTEILSLSRKDPFMRDVHDVVVIATGAGLRARELCHLTWDDIDLAKSSLTVGSKSAHIRTIAFGEDVLHVFQERRERRPDSKYVLGASPRSLLCRVSRKLTILSDRIGICHISIHSLRMTFILRLYKSGMHPCAIKAIAGVK